jgi:hypothetical protein
LGKAGRPAGRTKHEREEHLTLVASLKVRGLKNFQVAEATGRSRGQITKDVQLVEQRWLDSQTDSVEKHKARIAAGYEELGQEAWAAWESTKDPRHFANALATLRDYRALVGTDAPRRTETAHSGSVEIRHVEELSNADLDDIARGEFDLDGESATLASGKRVALPTLGAA